MSRTSTRRQFLAASGFAGITAWPGWETTTFAADATPIDGEALHFIRHHQFTDALHARLWRKNVDARRVLTLAEKDAVLQLSEVLTDRMADVGRSSSWRPRAASGLAVLGHVHCIPALASIVLDHNEDPKFRWGCGESLTKILDKRAIRAVIFQAFGSLRHDYPQAVPEIAHWLGQMIVDDGPKAPFRKRKRIEDFENRNEWRLHRAESVYQSWRKWWEENHDKPIKMQREAFWVP